MVNRLQNISAEELALLKYQRSVPNIFMPLVWVFYEQNWLKRSWWLPLIAYIPFVNLIMLRGWRLHVVRKMASEGDNLLPDFKIDSFLKEGILLWLVTGIYVLVPAIIIFGFGTGTFSSIGDVWHWLEAKNNGEVVQPFNQLIQTEVGDFLFSLGIEVLWIVASSPLYRAGMLRYATNGNLVSFFQPIQNIKFIARNAGDFIKLYLFGILLVIMIAAVSGVLAITLIGGILIPLVSILPYYWATAYEYGHIAHKDVQHVKQADGDESNDEYATLKSQS